MFLGADQLEEGVHLPLMRARGSQVTRWCLSGRLSPHVFSQTSTCWVSAGGRHQVFGAEDELHAEWVDEWPRVGEAALPYLGKLIIDLY